MNQPLRKLNRTGVTQFAEWLRLGARGPVPVYLLTNPETSDPLAITIMPARKRFRDRFEFGQYLNDLLAKVNPNVISHDQGFWTALVIVWFDQLCPVDSAGHRKLLKEYHYVLSSDFRHYYRHLVRSPWQLVKDHGANARFLLLSPRDQVHPLAVHGEILEQLGGRQQVLASRSIITAASWLYLNPEKGKPRTGVAGSGRGSARRFGLVLRQFDLTYDPETMLEEDLIALLPAEFDRWKKDDSTSRVGTRIYSNARDHEEPISASSIKS